MGEEKKRSWQVPIYLSPLIKTRDKTSREYAVPLLNYRLDCAQEALIYFIIQER